jgi:dTDP-4-dehydrorhamnose reductase
VSGILISGAGGYVGGRVVEGARGQREVHALWRTHEPPPGAASDHRLDLDDPVAIARALRATRPEVVVHTAYAMAAGPEPNLRWSRNLLSATAEAGARFLLVSTDLVFDGRRGWYRESEPPSPIIPYGAWKAELEAEVLAGGGLVARTSLVWSVEPLSESTAQLVVTPLREGRVPRLFEDEWRTPTEVHDLAAGLLSACDLAGPRVLHLTGPERISRLDFGRRIAARFGFDPGLLPAFRRAEVAPERPADTSLAAEQTLKVVPVRFRGPTELLG